MHAPPLYVQEDVNAKALIDDLLRKTRERERDFQPPGTHLGDEVMKVFRVASCAAARRPTDGLGRG